jgi:hypothetical protein
VQAADTGLTRSDRLCRPSIVVIVVVAAAFDMPADFSAGRNDRVHVDLRRARAQRPHPLREAARRDLLCRDRQCVGRHDHAVQVGGSQRTRQRAGAKIGAEKHGDAAVEMALADMDMGLRYVGLLTAVVEFPEDALRQARPNSARQPS